MATYLKYLTDSEQATLLGRTVRQSFEPGSRILKEGEKRHALFIIRDGSVRVELEHPEFNIEIAKLSTGEIFGEMSFLEGLEVSANVIADTPVEVDVCEADTMDDLFGGDDAFQCRFFKSIAFILSLRLRDTTLRGFG